jgi:hypothetical protein
MKKVINCLVLLLPLLGKAEVQKILDITAESDRSVLSLMFLDLENQNKVNNLIYQPDADEPKNQTFSTVKLLKDRVAIKEEKGVEVVGIKLKQLNATSYSVTLHYLFKFKLIKRTYKDKLLTAYFSAPDNRYLVQDDESKKLISKLHFISNYNDNGKEVGIAKIETF